MATRKPSKPVLTAQPTWAFKSFSELSFEDYHDILRLRGTVFASDDKSRFQDVDGLDPQALHLTARLDGELVAYARMLPYATGGEALIGRMVVAARHNKPALAKELLQRALNGVDVLFEPQPVRVGAPERLKKLYEGFGFRPAGEAYLEAGIPHLQMWRNATASL